MNIWYLSAHDQPKGRSSRTYDFAKELVKLGHNVTMFTNSICHWTYEDCLNESKKWRAEEIDGIRVIWLKTTPYSGNGWRRGINMISNARRSMQVSKFLTDTPDVVIGPSVPLGTGWAAAKIARQKNAAFVFEVRDVWPIALVDDGGLSKHNPIYYIFRLMEKKLYKEAVKISSTLPYLDDHVKDSGSDPSKLRCIPNGADLNRFEGFDEYSGGNDKLTVMYIGGYGQAHDVITIIRAAAILQERNNDNFKFIIIGNGPKKPECEKEASNNNLKNIEFRNPIPKADIPKAQSQSDILVASVLDSPIYRFGLNLNKMYDYFASSRPVIFSGKSKNDPVAESNAGYSIPPENPEAMVETLLKILALSPEQRRAMGRRGRSYVESKYQMSALGKYMEKMLIEAVNEKEL